MTNICFKYLNDSIEPEMIEKNLMSAKMDPKVIKRRKITAFFTYRSFTITLKSFNPDK